MSPCVPPVAAVGVVTPQIPFGHPFALKESVVPVKSQFPLTFICKIQFVGVMVTVLDQGAKEV